MSKAGNLGRTTDTRHTRRRVRRAGNSWGGPQSEEGRKLVGRTTDTRHRLRSAGISLGEPQTPDPE